MKILKLNSPVVGVIVLFLALLVFGLAAAEPSQMLLPHEKAELWSKTLLNIFTEWWDTALTVLIALGYLNKNIRAAVNEEATKAAGAIGLKKKDNQ